MKVLIADPDWRFSLKATRYLESHAHLVVSHTESEAALACARHWRPDLVILAAEVAEMGLMNAIYSMMPRPAVLLTEHLDRYDRAWRAWQTGGDELLIKPVFKSSELQQAIIMAMENATAGTSGRPTKATA